MPHQDREYIELIARACLVRDGAVLVCETPEGNYCYLPGGHIEFGESADLACLRELDEETGYSAKLGGLKLIAEERFRSASGGRHHELNLVFHVEHMQDPDGNPIKRGSPIESREPHLRFRWIDLGSLIDTDFRPASIRAWLMSGGAIEPGVPSVPVLLTEDGRGNRS